MQCSVHCSVNIALPPNVVERLIVEVAPQTHEPPVIELHHERAWRPALTASDLDYLPVSTSGLPPSGTTLLTSTVSTPGPVPVDPWVPEMLMTVDAEQGR